MSNRFKGVRPADFGEEVRFCCTSAWGPPPGFDHVWSACTTVEHNVSLLLGFDPDTFNGEGHDAPCVVIISDVHDEMELQRLALLGDALDGLGHGPLAILLAPHSPGAASRNLAQEDAFLHKKHTEFGFDGFLADGTTGLRFALQVRQQFRTLRSRVVPAMDAYKKRHAKNAEAASLRRKIDRLFWDYLAVRRVRFLPQLDPRLETNGIIQIPDFSVNAVMTKRTVWGCAAHQLTRHGTGETQVLHLVKKSSIQEVADVTGTKLMIDVMKKLTDQCPHPNVLKLFEVYHGPQHLMFRFEHCGSDSLYTRLQSREATFKAQVPLDAGMVTDILIQIWAAIGHLHTTANVCHRDIKPESFLLTEGPDSTTIKLTNFPLSMVTRDKPCCWTVCGTTPFVAPEVISSEGEAYNGFTADMWSLGILMMEILCGLRIIERSFDVAEETASGVDLQEAAAMAAICDGFKTHGSAGRLMLNCVREELRSLGQWLLGAIDGMISVDTGSRWRAPELIAVLAELEEHHHGTDCKQ